MATRRTLRAGLLFAVAALGCAGCWEGLTLLQDPGSDAEILFPLTVGRQAQQPYPDTSVDVVLQNASDLMQRIDPGCEDNATAVVFTRQGDVAALNVAPAIVTTEAQLDALFAQPQDIKIVNMMIGVCGVPANQAATILGCATNGGSAVVIASSHADVWAHEWGHVLGLRHRSDCRRNLMNAVGGQTDAVNSFERVVFLTALRGVFEVQPAQREVNQVALDLQQAPGEPTHIWLERLISERYLAGIPAEVLESVDATVSADLRALLADPEFADDAANVVRIMGFTRDPALAAVLIDQIVSPVGPLDEFRFAAVAERFLALGRLAPHEDEGSIRDWLIAGSDPANWAGRRPLWTYLGISGEDLDLLLARLSILALSVGEDDAALEHLRALRDQGHRFISQYDALRDQILEGIARLQRTGRFGPGFALDRQP